MCSELQKAMLCSVAATLLLVAMRCVPCAHHLTSLSAVFAACVASLLMLSSMSCMLHIPAASVAQVVPTCQDTNITAQGPQRFVCPFNWVFDNASVSAILTPEQCCIVSAADAWHALLQQQTLTSWTQQQQQQQE